MMTNKTGVNDLRELFLRFFESKEHLRLPSFSLIPQNDQSLLLINSGMAPMKPWFKGEEEPPRRRVCTCQKCIRTGDIENIGHTARHGTYFEMLGNFSFGDYFKHDAIHWAWEFLTSPEWVGLDPDRLYPSVLAKRITSGSTVLVPAVPVPKFIMTAAPNTAAESLAVQWAVNAIGIWKSGMSYFPSSTMMGKAIILN